MIVSFIARRLIQKNHNLFRIPKRNGYVVLLVFLFCNCNYLLGLFCQSLKAHQYYQTSIQFHKEINFSIHPRSVPEIGEDLPQKNPLLRENDLPEFTNITIEKCIAAIGRQTVEFEEKVNSLEKSFTSK